MEHSFICCCVKLIFLNFARYSVKLFVPVFQFVFLLHHRFYRTCKTRRQISKVSKRRDNFDREVIGVFWYHCVMERLYHPACGAYTSFGIAAHSTSHGRHRKLRFISDVSVDPVRVLRLAARCTACQLDPSQLMDVVEDLLAE